ncbi:MAG: 4-phosphoerythronate dehydrogenase [Phycisphaerales bacterium]|nr:MAG: 4-phosphoerythronate dehydrogenase [Phycisphaerales bacterium]
MKIVADANIPLVEECFSSIADVTVTGGRDMTPAVVADADALLVRSITPVDERLLAGSSVRFVGTATIGFDHVDRDYLDARHIGFASAPGSNANSAAEYIIAALLSVGQKHGIRLEGKSIGVIGVGNVGGRVAKKCEALGMHVRRNDPPLQRQTGSPIYVPLEALYDCDFITFHTPLTRDGIDKTFHLAHEAFFASLKEGVVVLNASRGAVVDSQALAAAIDDDHLGPVGLDVWEHEPSIDVELLERVALGSPHIAGYSLDGKIAGLIMIFQAVCEYFGLEPQREAADFLPAPEVPEIDLGIVSEDDEAALAQAVERVYSVQRDDASLRPIAKESPERRGAFFDALRKNYPVRREFQNTTVVVAEPGGAVVRKLLGIGFKVKGRSS